MNPELFCPMFDKKKKLDRTIEFWSVHWAMADCYKAFLALTVERKCVCVWGGVAHFFTNPSCSQAIRSR